MHVPTGHATDVFDTEYLLCITFLSRMIVKEGILWLCKEAMKFKMGQTNRDWLFVLPLCHFLSGACEPFARLALYPVKRDFSARVEEYYKGLQQKSLEGYVCII